MFSLYTFYVPNATVASTRRRDAVRAYKAANRELKALWDRAAKIRRRARERNAEGRFGVKDIQRLFTDQKGLCAICSVDLVAGYHVDHIMPLSRGGSNWPINLQLLCRPCNLSKWATIPQAKQ